MGKLEQGLESDDACLESIYRNWDTLFPTIPIVYNRRVVSVTEPNRVIIPMQ